MREMDRLSDGSEGDYKKKRKKKKTITKINRKYYSSEESETEEESNERKSPQSGDALSNAESVDYDTIDNENALTDINKESIETHEESLWYFSCTCGASGNNFDGDFN
jgi:hypothetical protein